MGFLKKLFGGGKPDPNLSSYQRQLKDAKAHTSDGGCQDSCRIKMCHAAVFIVC